MTFTIEHEVLVSAPYNQVFEALTSKGEENEFAWIARSKVPY